MTTPSLSFTRGDAEHAAPAILRTWHTSLAEQHKGDRATLRRALTAGDAVFVPAFHRLRTELLKAGYLPSAERLARVALVLAHVRDDAPSRPTARQMAAPKDGASTPAVSHLRFRRLVEEEDADEAVSKLRRLLPQLGGSANICDLADAAYWWNARTRRQWAFTYFEHAPKE